MDKQGEGRHQECGEGKRRERGEGEGRNVEKGRSIEKGEEYEVMMERVEHAITSRDGEE